MNRNDLYRAIGEADERSLERSEQRKTRKKSRRPIWFSAVAAVLVLAIVGVVLLHPKTGKILPQSYALNNVVYPEMPDYPLEENFYVEETGEWDYEKYEQQYEAWRESWQSLKPEDGYAEGMSDVQLKLLRELSRENGEENLTCSPVNLYLAFAMLAETAEGESREQILACLGESSLESLREKAHMLWRHHYRDDGVVTSLLGSSLWLPENAGCREETLKTLEEQYYASVFAGNPANAEYTEVFRQWLNEHTGGMLEESVKGMELNENLAFALATTIYFKAAWADKFSEEQTSEDVFHAPDGDETVSFMHETADGVVYTGDHFSAVARMLNTADVLAWIILPDEDTPLSELIESEELGSFLKSGRDWQSTFGEVHLSIPKLDVTSTLDLSEMMKALGMTDVFDESKSDFSGLLEDGTGVTVSRAEHSARLVADEQGLTAAAYTVIATETSAEPEEAPPVLYFTANRPFLMVLTDNDGTILFAASVYHPVG